jgi:hypothetical protein
VLEGQVPVDTQLPHTVARQRFVGDVS